ncbi:MAG: hypothetical protein ACT6R7_02280 [Brevundimonas aurantiaca]|uniref:hypothetical protein n=1 Tax=Brevundimonas aurantiaca TaxID=74316 RepID=UPI004033F8C1
MVSRAVILVLAAWGGLAACTFAPIPAPAPTDPVASLERREDAARRDGERVNLCRMMNRDDPRYKDMDCKDVMRRVGA